MNEEFFANANEEELRVLLCDTNNLKKALQEKIDCLVTKKYQRRNLLVKDALNMLSHFPSQKKQLSKFDYIDSYRNINLNLPRNVDKTYELLSMVNEDRNSILLVSNSSLKYSFIFNVLTLDEYWFYAKGRKFPPVSRILIDEPNLFDEQSLLAVLGDIITNHSIAEDFYIFSMGTNCGSK